MYLNMKLKVSPTNVALGATTASTATLATLYGLTQTKQDEQSDQPKEQVPQEKVVEVIKDNPETLATLQKEQANNKELQQSLDKAESTKNDLTKRVKELEEKVKQQELSIEGLENEKRDLQDQVARQHNQILEKEEEISNQKVAINDLFRRVDENSVHSNYLDSIWKIAYENLHKSTQSKIDWLLDFIRQRDIVGRYINGDKKCLAVKTTSSSPNPPYHVGCVLNDDRKVKEGSVKDTSDPEYNQIKQMYETRIKDNTALEKLYLNR